MLQTHSYWILGASWISVAMAIWAVEVPAWMSVTTFGWVNAAALGAGTILVTAVRSARPTQSIAQVLYETEHPTGQDR